MKKLHGATITAVSMGPSQAIDALSEAMGMGADKAVLLSDRAFAGADTWATSYTLGQAIRTIGAFDLILAGRQAIDGDTAQVGPQVAEYLAIPQVTCVAAIETANADHLVVRRMIADGYERIHCPLPALLTVVRAINTPRYPDMAGLLLACREKAPIKIWNAADIGVTTADIGLEGSLTQVIKTFAPKAERHGEILTGDTQTVARELVAKLDGQKLI
jgi:electron transfer flavoprotein beta subunit